jgi:hypothetical protein
MSPLQEHYELRSCGVCVWEFKLAPNICFTVSPKSYTSLSKLPISTTAQGLCFESKLGFRWSCTVSQRCLPRWWSSQYLRSPRYRSRRANFDIKGLVSVVTTQMSTNWCHAFTDTSLWILPGGTDEKKAVASGKKRQGLGLAVLTAVTMKTAAFWVAAPCRLVQFYQSSRGLYCSHH